VYVRTVKHENVVQAHKHTELSQNTAYKYKKQWIRTYKSKNIKENTQKDRVLIGYLILKEQLNI